MPRMIAAVFENRGAAQNALGALIAGGIAQDRIRVIGEHHPSSEMAPLRERPARGGEVAALGDLALPEEDRGLFEQALERGHAVLCARVDDAAMDEAIRTVEMFDPLDLDHRSRDWQGGQSGIAGQGGVDVGAPLGAGLTAGMGQGNTSLSSLPGAGTLADDTSTLGTADLRADASLSDQGRSTLPTGGRRSEERAGAPGVLELGGGQGSASPDARPHLHRREMTRIGRVRSYVREMG